MPTDIGAPTIAAQAARHPSRRIGAPPLVEPYLDRWYAFMTCLGPQDTDPGLLGRRLQR
jgi:hypothetical protein